jgi:hypothetical protein
MITEKCSALTKALAPFDNQKCDDKTIPLPMKACNYLLASRKGGGKSSLILSLLTLKESPWYKHFDLIFLFSPTALNDDKMKPLLDDIGDQHYTDLTNENMHEVIAKCEAYTDRHKRKKKKGKPIYCIIYDDCIHQIKTKKASEITRLVTQNRHIAGGITNIFSLQKYNSIPTIIRANLDCISFFHTENEQELDTFVKEIGSEEKIRALYNFATATPYSFLHINMYSQPTRYYRKFDPIEYKPAK